jgi:hypothetical protein
VLGAFILDFMVLLEITVITAVIIIINSHIIGIFQSIAIYGNGTGIHIFVEFPQI